MTVGALVRLAAGQSGEGGLAAGELARVTKLTKLKRGGSAVTGVRRLRDGAALKKYGGWRAEALCHGLQGLTPLTAAVSVAQAVDI